MLIILPAGMSPRGLVESFPLQLRTLISEYNGVSAEAAKLQLRLATHMGLIHQNAHGVAGDDINYLFGYWTQGPCGGRLPIPGRRPYWPSPGMYTSPSSSGIRVVTRPNSGT